MIFSPSTFREFEDECSVCAIVVVHPNPNLNLNLSIIWLSRIMSEVALWQQTLTARFLQAPTWPVVPLIISALFTNNLRSDNNVDGRICGYHVSVMCNHWLLVCSWALWFRRWASNSIKGGTIATTPISTRIDYPTQFIVSPSNMASPQKRNIGGTEVFCLGYGAMGLSAFYGKPLSDEERFKVCWALCHYANITSQCIHVDSEGPWRCIWIWRHLLGQR